MVSLLLILNRCHTSGVSIVDFEQVNVFWLINQKVETSVRKTCHGSCMLLF